MFMVTKQFECHKRLLYVQDSVHDYMKSGLHKTQKPMQTPTNFEMVRSGGRSTVIRTYAKYGGEAISIILISPIWTRDRFTRRRCPSYDSREIKSVEICMDWSSWTMLSPAKRRGYFRRTQKLKRVSCGQRLAFLTEEGKIMTLQCANNFDGCMLSSG